MNYFNSLPLRLQLEELSKCRFMDKSEFASGVDMLKGKKVVILGCGAQGLNQGLNMRDSGLDISYALRAEAIAEKRQSWQNATDNSFNVGTFEELIPTADLVLNLTPDKQHTPVINKVMPLMKKGACLAYSHGFNIVEEGMQIREDLTVIMVAPKCPGTEVREEYKRGFGVPTLIAVHRENDPNGNGLELAKAYAAATGGHRAGVLESSFVAEVKSDLMGEQTILCGMLQTGSILLFERMVALGVDKAYASKLIQHGWETVSEGLKQGGITNMMDRLDNPSKILAFEASEKLKTILRPLFNKHMDDIMEGHFSSGMMEDWANDDAKLLGWREETGKTAFELSSTEGAPEIREQEYYDHGIMLVAMIKAGVELCFETLTSAGVIDASAYYESLHEVPLIANLIGRKKLYEMNKVISDTAEYGCYLFANAAVPMLKDYIGGIGTDVIGGGVKVKDNGVDDRQLISVNDAIRNHPIEAIGRTLRGHMTDMKKVV
jgi:ketol-acid reductoisomerase